MICSVILAAGSGKRMGSNIPKVLHTIGGKPLVHHVREAAAALGSEKILPVLSPALQNHPLLSSAGSSSYQWVPVIQDTPQGTGKAVEIALKALAEHDRIFSLQDPLILILCGDTPLICQEDLSRLVNQAKQRSGFHVLGAPFSDPRHYGRLVTQEDHLLSIVEFKEATPEQQQISLCNTGVMAAPLSLFQRFLPLLTRENSAGEYYLTDVIGLARQADVSCFVTIAHAPESFHGINTPGEWAQAEKRFQKTLTQQWMDRGVIVMDPDRITLCHDTIIEPGAVIYPDVFIGEKVRIGANATIYPYCSLTETILDAEARVGPFAHLRGQCHIGHGAEVGNFVEMKKVQMGSQSKVKHLSYLGDTTLGEDVNIGAGVITCNYDGFTKHITHIKDHAFVGSHSTLIAPITVGEGALVGAGTVVTEDIPPNALSIGRSAQKNSLEGAHRYRQSKERSPAS